jgi:SAM-dependent methyltransferase
VTQDKVEILSVDLLNRYRDLVDELKLVAKELRLEFGWHYLLDLTWIISHLDTNQVGVVLDAGAGTGVMQWFLSNRGVDVVSVDRGSRAHLPIHFRAYSPVVGLRAEDLATRPKTAFHLLRYSTRRRAILEAFLPIVRVRRERYAEGRGKVFIYNQDLSALSMIEDNTIDVVVSVSALEHNTPVVLRAVVHELLRVLKPNGKLLATLGAAVGEDWFHEPSQGWNYTEASMRDIFQLAPDASSNYEDYDRLFNALKENRELSEGLAGFYKTSGHRGMPWGKWAPQYIPVGVCKVKPSAAG